MVYRPSHYMIIEQDILMVELFSRVEDGWSVEIFTQKDAVISLPALHVSLKVEDIYQDLFE